MKLQLNWASFGAFEKILPFFFFCTSALISRSGLTGFWWLILSQAGVDLGSGFSLFFLHTNKQGKVIRYSNSNKKRRIFSIYLFVICYWKLKTIIVLFLKHESFAGSTFDLRHPDDVLQDDAAFILLRMRVRKPDTLTLLSRFSE